MAESGWPYPLAGASTPRQLGQAALQAADLLGLYGAELARIIGLRCEDVAALSSGRWLLETDSEAWRRAQQWVSIYDLLYRHHAGDGVAMVHWLHVDLPGQGTSPHRLLVDAADLRPVLNWLQRAAPLSQGSGRG